MNPRAWRWWHWLAVSIVLLILSTLAVAVSLRGWSVGRLESVEARLRAEGRPTRYAQVLAEAPVRDAAAYAAWLALEPRWDRVTSLSQEVDPWLARGAPQPTPPAIATWLAANAGLVEDTAAVLRRGGLAIGAWPDAALFADGRHPSLVEAASTRTMSLLMIRSCAVALAASALAQGEGGPLADLDRLVANLNPNCLLDCMILRALAPIRDRAHLAALLQRPADAASMAWAASDPVVLSGGRAGMRGERLQFSAVFADSTLHDGPFSSRGGIYTWTIGPADAANMVSVMAGMESRLDGAPWTMPPLPRWSIISRIAIPNIDESSQTLIEGDAQERAARIAAALLVAWRAGEAPPADQAGLAEPLRARLLPGTGAATLRYRRDGDGFAIDIDPAAPRPPGMHRVPRPLVTGKPLVVENGVAIGVAPRQAVDATPAP